MVEETLKLIDGQVIKAKKDTNIQCSSESLFVKMENYKGEQFIIPYTSVLYIKKRG